MPRRKSNEILSEAKKKADDIINNAMIEAENHRAKQKEELGKEAERKAKEMLTQAQAQTEQILSTAKAEADKQSKKWKEEAIKDAEKQGKDLIAEAKAQADKILKEAGAQAAGQKGKLEEESKKSLDALLADAKSRADKIVKEAESQAAGLKTRLAEESRKEQERILAEAKAKADEYLKKAQAETDEAKAKKTAEGQAAGQNLQTLRNEVEVLTEEIEKLQNLKAWHEKDFFSFLTFNLELLETWKKGLDIPIPLSSGRNEVDNLRGEIKKLSNIKNQLEKYFESFMDFNEKLLEAMKKGAADWDGIK